MDYKVRATMYVKEQRINRKPCWRDFFFFCHLHNFYFVNITVFDTIYTMTSLKLSKNVSSFFKGKDF